jgi:hypothetical protein
MGGVRVDVVRARSFADFVRFRMTSLGRGYFRMTSGLGAIGSIDRGFGSHIVLTLEIRLGHSFVLSRRNL